MRIADSITITSTDVIIDGKPLNVRISPVTEVVRRKEPGALSEVAITIYANSITDRRHEQR